jgi:GT2 family glycosyltransferase
MNFEAHCKRAVDRPVVSVVIVNYNGKKFLTECLNSLLTKAFKKYSFEVIVVDNCSQDGSQDFLRTFPGITYIESTVNTGFTGGNNIGAHAAKGDFLLLLNNDTRIETCLDSLVETVIETDIGAIGCQLRYGDGRLQFSMGYEHSPWRIALSWLGLERKPSLPSVFRRMDTSPHHYTDQAKLVDWISGAVLLTPKRIWDELGGLDEFFFMYCEDVDYCRRVRDQGWKVLYRGDCIVTHYEGAGRTWIGCRALLNTSRSYFIYLTKHYGKLQGRITCLGLAVIFSLRFLVFQITSNSQSNPSLRKLRADKATAYKLAAQQLLNVAMSGKAPQRS